MARYTKPLVVLIIALGVLTYGIVRGLFPSPDEPNYQFFNFIPGTTGNQQLVLVYAFYFITGTLGTILGGYIFAPIFVWFHKTFFGKKLTYGIEERPEPEKFSDMGRTIMPALMAINLASIIGPHVTYIFLSTDVTSTGGEDIVLTMLLIVVVSLFTNALSTGLFQGVWFILDAGLVFSNRKAVEGSRDPVEVHAVGSYFKGFIEGYTGIGVAITFYQLIYELTMSNISGGMDFSSTIMAIVALAPVPFILAIGALPGLIILDKLKESRKKFILSVANKNGITDKVEVTLAKTE